MTDATDAAVGAIVPLIALGVVANVAGNMMHNNHEHSHKQHTHKQHKLMKPIKQQPIKKHKAATNYW